MVCGNNRADKILKFFKAYINNHGVPRNIHVDQGTNFMSRDVKAFCNGEGIEIVHSPVNDHRATGCVERTIGSLKKSLLTYSREEPAEPLEKMLERALGALRFANNATLKITPFEAHDGREANTVLRNLIKKPSLRNLNWPNAIKSKSTCLDERDTIVQGIPSPADTNWGARSDSEYGNRRKHPLLLTDQQAINQQDEPTARTMGETAGPSLLPSVSVYQRTGDKNAKRYRLLKNSIIAESKHTLTICNGHLLRKSGVAVKKSPATVSKQSRKNVPKPSTPQDLRKKLAAEGLNYPAVHGRRFEQTNDTHSDDEDYQPLITRRTATGKIPASRTTGDGNSEAEQQQPERANETQEKSNEASGQIEEAEMLMAERSNSGATERANGGEIAANERRSERTTKESDLKRHQGAIYERRWKIRRKRKIRRNGSETREKEAFGLLFKPGLE